MAPNTRAIVDLYDRLDERGQALITELMLRLLPADDATPEELAAIAETQAEYERGEYVRHDDIDWGA